jgi:HSP90 family molecular chaperone
MTKVIIEIDALVEELQLQIDAMENHKAQQISEALIDSIQPALGELVKNIQAKLTENNCPSAVEIRINKMIAHINIQEKTDREIPKVPQKDRSKLNDC